MRSEGRLSRNWWEDVRREVLTFAGANPNAKEIVKAVHPVDPNILESAMPEKIVVTYVSRQEVGRRLLVESDHETLVKSLEQLVQRKNAEWVRDGLGNGTAKEWELQVVNAERMAIVDQIKVFARTSVSLTVLSVALLADTTVPGSSGSAWKWSDPSGPHGSQLNNYSYRDILPLWVCPRLRVDC